MVRIFSQYVSRKTLLLVAIESVVISLALRIGVRLRFWNDPAAFEFYTVLPDFALQAATVVICIQVSFYYYELYDRHAAWRAREHFVRLGESLGAACLLLGAVYFVFPSLMIRRGIFFIALGGVVTSVALTRVIVDLVWRKAVGREEVLILGTGRMAADIAREITRRHELSLRLVGFIEPRRGGGGETGPFCGHPIVGNVASLEGILNGHLVSRIIVAMADQQAALPVGNLIRARTRGVRVEDAPSAIAALTGRIPLETIQSNWFIFSEGFRRTRLTLLLKRSIDLLLSVIGLLASAPIMALTAVAVKLDSHGPAFYRQQRVGVGGECFELLKFRSMRVDAESQNGAQWAEENDPRVTRLGRHLRKYRLDELPQFINVIRGEMSFVGPRPERPEFVEILRQRIPYYDERHTVRPGITGWAQVRYPYGASVEDALKKLEYDLFYLKSVSLLFDCAIVFETVKTVVVGRGGR